MDLIQVVILSLLGLLSLYYLIAEIQEIYFLKNVLHKILGKSKIESIDDIIKIKNYLQTTISYNEPLKNKKRPLLRHTASQILKNKYGFCGENARVAIKLFLIGGMKARRIYLFRKEWQHVLIEHEFNSCWYMFDGHYDPSTVLKDEDVTTIPSEDILAYPNDYPNNPYLDFCRIKLFHITTPLKSYAKIKLPSLLIYLFESPYLIKGIWLMTMLLLTFFVLQSS